MRKQLKNSAIIIFAAVSFAACNKKDTPAGPCDNFGYDIDYDETAAIGTQNNGSITITYPIGGYSKL